MLSDETIFLFGAFSAVIVLLGGAVTLLLVRRGRHLDHLLLEQHRLQNESRNRSIQEAERMMNQVSKEVHDSIGHAAAMAKHSLHSIIRINDNERLVPFLEDIGKQVDSIALDVTNISHSLNHNYIKSRDLVTLLQDDLEHIGSHGSIACDLVITGVRKPLNPETSLLAYRIAQQAFSNILKHSRATEVNVILEYGVCSFKMTIEDDGIGLVAEKLATGKGIGLDNMRKRAAMMNGDLLIRSEPGNGCIVILTLPTVDYM